MQRQMGWNLFRSGLGTVALVAILAAARSVQAGDRQRGCADAPCSQCGPACGTCQQSGCGRGHCGHGCRHGHCGRCGHCGHGLHGHYGKHEAIDNLKMPAMTMMFRVEDPALLKDLKVGDAVVLG